MRAHQLAHQLLGGPDILVFGYSEDASAYGPITQRPHIVECVNPDYDANGDRLPVKFIFLEVDRG